jgi:hypothetical protein
MCLIGFSLALI